MHPKDAEWFEWDEWNERELWAHRILPWEVEQVFLNGAAWSRNKKAGSGDYKMLGRTDGGRRLTIVVQVKSRGRMLRAITGWDSTPGELTRQGGR